MRFDLLQAPKGKTDGASLADIPLRGSSLLQRKCACGNKGVASTGECEECKLKKRLQPKLLVGADNDPLEREAERIGNRIFAVTSGPSSGSARQQIQRQSATRGNTPDCAPPSVTHVLGQAGRPLERTVRQDMEQRFSHDFSQVRIHDDSEAIVSARDVNALAYTVGSHIVFGSGSYNPQSTTGKGLLAHELAHVIQQRGYTPSLDRLPLDVPGQSAHEHEAERVRYAVESNHPVGCVTTTSSSASVQRRPGSPAGGCGVCYGSPKNAGITAHQIIQAAFNPLVSTEFPLLPGPGDDNGRLDLVRFTGPDSAQIGEIKPANAAGFAQGQADLVWYETQLRSLGFKVSRMVLPPPVSALAFPSLAPPPCPPVQELFVDPPINGVYTYWCLPDFADLVGRCPCRKPPDPIGKKAKERVGERKKVKEKETTDEKDKGKDKEKPDKIRPPGPEVLIPVGLALLLGWAAKQAAKQGGKRVLAPAYIVAAIVLVGCGAEVSAGLEGDDALEAMFKAAADQGNPIPDDLKEAIKNDSALKQIVLEASKKGGATEAQRKLGEQLTRVITENRDQFTDEEIQELLKVTEQNRDVIPNAPATVESLKRVLEAKRNGASGQGNSGSDGNSGGQTQTPEGDRKDTPPSSTLPPTTTPPERLVAGLAQAGAGGPRFTEKFKDRLLAAARAANPPLTNGEVSQLLQKIGSAEGKSEDEVIASVERGIATIRTPQSEKDGVDREGNQKSASTAGSDTASAPGKGPQVEVDKPDSNKKPSRNEQEIIAAYDKALAKLEWIEPGNSYLVMNKPPYQVGKTYAMTLLGRDPNKMLYIGSAQVTIVSKNGDTWKISMAGGSMLYTKGAQFGRLRPIIDTITPPDIAKGQGGGEK